MHEITSEKTFNLTQYSLFIQSIQMLMKIVTCKVANDFEQLAMTVEDFLVDQEEVRSCRIEQSFAQSLHRCSPPPPPPPLAA